jgi:uncharacterized OB-fold protein
MLADRVPYNVAVIALRDYPQVRVTGNVIDASPDELAIGKAVTATWATVSNEGQEELRLLQWRLHC